MRKIPFIAAFLFVLTTNLAFAQVVGDTLDAPDNLLVEDTVPSSEDSIHEGSEIMMMLESLGSLPFFEEQYLVVDTGEMNIYGYDYGEIPMFDDSVYRKRIEVLASQTTMPLVYNALVREKIDGYVMRMRGFTGRMLGFSYIYFPLFEEMLDKYNMPLELRCLAVVESALNPLAVSRAGAKGLWQFMYLTGKQYGLKSTTLVDERFDPLKSTEAACQYLLDLYGRYKDWFLALAAYNAGPGNVNKAIARAGGVMDYWAICPYLPGETRNYVPSFIAANYVVNYAREHNLYPVSPEMLVSGTDTVVVHDFLTFAQLNEALGVPIKDLRSYNPQYTKDIIPANDSTYYVLRLPSQYALQFVQREKEVYAFLTQEKIDKEKILREAAKVQPSTPKYHTVKKGETLSSIAKKYNVSVPNLKKWNKLKSDNIRPKQKLRVSAS